jgi:hypothetical protein
MFKRNYSSCTGRSTENPCSSSGGAQEKRKTGWNSGNHQNWYFQLNLPSTCNPLGNLLQFSWIMRVRPSLLKSISAWIVYWGKLGNQTCPTCNTQGNWLPLGLQESCETLFVYTTIPENHWYIPLVQYVPAFLSLITIPSSNYSSTTCDCCQAYW